MNLLTQLWRDDAGAVLSAEAVVLGTVAVTGATVGLSAASQAVNDELTEFAYAIRSLDQSYSVPGFRSGTAYSAPSHYRQPSVESSIKQLQEIVVREQQSVEEHRQRLQKLEPQESPAASKPSKKPEAEQKVKKQKPADAQADAGEFPYRP